MLIQLTPNQRDVLGSLAVAKEICPEWDGWLTPMFCGGKDGSHHSATLKTLVRKRLAERKQRAGWIRPSYLYRITQAGRAALTRKE